MGLRQSIPLYFLLELGHGYKKIINIVIFIEIEKFYVPRNIKVKNNYIQFALDQNNHIIKILG
jgi:predicted nuclease of restriction endonuclease-like (RecB) superfamily